MKVTLMFIFSMALGFFDLTYFMVFFSIMLVMLFMDFGGMYFSGWMIMDNLSFFLITMTSMIYMFCVMTSKSDYWKKNHFTSFLFFMFSIFFTLFLCFSVMSMFLFYISFELVFMFMFMFVLSWGYSPERLQASLYMVFYTIVVSFPIFVFLVVSDSFSTLNKFYMFSNMTMYWWFFMFLVFLVKLPVYGVHLWLPKAHVEAPVTGSMVLAGVLLKLGGYGFYRFSFYALKSLSTMSSYTLSWGIIGGVISCFLCMRQSDLKAFIAYSSICHMGLGLSGLHSFSLTGTAGGVFMLIAHGFCSSCLFFMLFVLYERLHTRSLHSIKGILIIAPTMALFLFLFSILNMGVPPSFAFFSEVMLISGIMKSSMMNILMGATFLLLAGIYGILFYTITSHGKNTMEEFSSTIEVRENTLMYTHMFPLIALPIMVNYYFS